MRRSIVLFALAVLLSARVRAQLPCHAEYDGPTYYDNTSMGGPWIGLAFTPASSFTATALELFTGEASGPTSLSLYTDNAASNQPGAQLDTAAWNMAIPDGWQGAPLPATPPLTGGVRYWLVWRPVGGCQASIDGAAYGSGLGQPYKASFDNGQTWTGPYQDVGHHWMFRVYGICSSTPVVYCTAGTSSNGCVPSISASGNPNVAHTAPCQITIASVEGQRTGIVFYGLTQLVQPWCTSASGSSFLCVKPPTMRTGVQSSGGTVGACNGALTLNWNNFQSSSPGALGSPWSAGNRACVQGWFRDPPSCKTTSLSDAVELTYQP